MQWKIGSLFDGSGGFPLAAELCGIEPTWASEVEPYPIAVTKSRFPKMRHLGDISKINGAEIEPVDLITFGSPCQNLSVAGKGAGIKHKAKGDEVTTQSGLFMEAVRIIKEMREATNGKYPTFALWENVPGAFSSNKGEDFRIVLEEIIKIAEPTATMPAVPPFGWAYADSYDGDGWSLAYRVFDAQYWGVPQRRRRIHLIADFRGQRARKILFEREGLRGYLAQSRPQRERVTAYVEGSSGTADSEGACVSAGFKAGQGSKARGVGWEEEKSPTLASEAGGNSVPSVCVKTYDARGNGDGDTVSTITGDHENRITDYTNIVCQRIPKPFFSEMYKRIGKGGGEKASDEVDFGSVICMATQQGGAEIRTDDRAPTVTAAAGMSGNNQPVVCYVVDQGGETTVRVYESHPMSSYIKEIKGEVIPTVTAKWRKGAADTPLVCEEHHVSEDLTPTLTTTHGGEPAVVYQAMGGDVAGTLDASYYKGCGMRQGTEREVVAVEYRENPIAIDRAAFNQGKNAQYPPQFFTDGTTPTLVARGPSAVATEVNEPPPSNEIIKKDAHYIVRRLTPTECARLQGFADRWGDIDEKEDFTDEEYAFWLSVRNTHAAINGKAQKDYTKAQMLTWYKKLHSDSAEYKMWGNGIALPPALYCMQGIKEALEENKEEI